ncbi:hypothetical protein [Antarcticimicrobium luteum]|nr:hypothetical protein [Antarcticimicrobium luteum]
MLLPLASIRPCAGGLPPTVTTGVVAVVSYLGPRGLFELIERRWGASPKP